MTEAPAPGAREPWHARLRRRATAPVDSASLAAFRILYGVVMAIGAVRFLLNGWVDQVFLQPKFHFKYWGFEWVQPWSGHGMHLHFALLAVLATLVAVGLFYRVAIVLFVLAFAYAELIDVTVYLNHYYLASLLGLLLCFLPAHAAWSLDALRRPRAAGPFVPALCTWILRFQVGVVYFFAGIAKLGSDWLLAAQPLNIWLSSHSDFPVLGPLFGEPWVAYAMGWGGFLYDTTIPLWLSLRRTRAAAYVVVLAFHTMVGALFPIGMFPFIMTAAALVFFPPDWPRRLLARGAGLLPRLGALGRVPVAPPDLSFRLGRAPVLLLAVYAAVQVLVPLRHRLYEGSVLWHEQGMRWSWKVMVREKDGAVTFVAHSPSRGRTLHVSPGRYLTAVQEREMSSQPDLILQLAHRIGEDLRRQGYADVEVHADTRVSLNGRPGVAMIDPTVDLLRCEDGVAPFRWVLPEPETAPPRLERRRRTVAGGRSGRDAS